MPQPPGMTATIEPLLHSPRLPALVDEPLRVLAAEQARRQRFYEELTEDTRAEFINGQVNLRTLAQLAQG